MLTCMRNIFVCVVTYGEKFSTNRQLVFEKYTYTTFGVCSAQERQGFYCCSGLTPEGTYEMLVFQSFWKSDHLVT